jgi:NADPH2:quinone reductase
MSKAIRLYEFGGPEKLKWEEVQVPSPAEGEVLIRHTAVGLNFIDVYVRTGLYPRPLPTGVGSEAAGVIEALGAKVRGLKVGDRVVYMSYIGAYAERRALPASGVIKLPPGVSDEQAAAVLLKGLTTWYLLRQTYKVKRGDVILLPAASGGVGLILSQWARALGAKVIGVVGSEGKAALAKQHGCHHVLVGYEALAERVRKLNKGQGVDVVYDGVGKDTFNASLDCLKPRHLMVSFGNASGPVAPFTALELARRGSLYFTRTAGGDYLGEASARSQGARELFALLRSRKIRVVIGQRFPLAEAARAHTELEARRTVGSSILVP